VRLVRGLGDVVEPGRVRNELFRTHADAATDLRAQERARN
jgi:hypothetical protein